MSLSTEECIRLFLSWPAETRLLCWNIELSIKAQGAPSKAPTTTPAQAESLSPVQAKPKKTRRRNQSIGCPSYRKLWTDDESLVMLTEMENHTSILEALRASAKKLGRSVPACRAQLRILRARDARAVLAARIEEAQGNQPKP